MEAHILKVLEHINIKNSNNNFLKHLSAFGLDMSFITAYPAYGIKYKYISDCV